MTLERAGCDPLYRPTNAKNQPGNAIAPFCCDTDLDLFLCDHSAESRFRWFQCTLCVDALGSGGNFNGNSQVDAKMALLGSGIDFAFSDLSFHRA